MAVDKEKTLDDFKTEPIGVINLINERRARLDNKSFEDSRAMLFAWSLVCAVALICLSYFALPISKVKAVSVVGNNYLDKQYIEKISKVTYNSRYFLSLPSFIERRIEKDPLVKNARVTLLPNHIVQIQVEEKEPVGYRYSETGPKLLMATGEEIGLTSDYMPMIARLPFVDGFTTDEQTHKLTTALSSVNRNMIDEMAEIRQYTLDYDDETLQIQMRDGGYFFTSYYSIETVNAYYDIYVRMNDRNHCFYAESGKSIVSERACPWDEVPVYHDYWLDENGDYLYNKWGDKAVKHYYHDDNGDYYLDENGNRIVIPINEFVEDDPDENFEENYFAGYYKTGELVIPPPEEEEWVEEGGEQVEEAPQEEPQEETQEG